MTLPQDPDVRRYRQEKARKQRRDAKLVQQAKVQYDRLCQAQRLRPMTTSKAGAKNEPKKVCACGAKCWGVRCWPCRRKADTRVFPTSKKLKRRAA